VQDFIGEKNQQTTTCKLCRDRAKKQKCAAKDRHNNPCRGNSLVGEKFCKNHEYMREYTDEMLTCVELCSGCKKMYFLDGYKICKKCRERSEENRGKARENVVLCSSDGCKFKRTEENEFCGHHQPLEIKKEKVFVNRLCSRGCKTELAPDYKFTKCPACLEVERKNDQEKRRAARLICENIVVKQDKELKVCTRCCKELELDCFKSDNDEITKTCINCRKQNNRVVRQNVEESKERAKEIEQNDPKRQYIRYINSSVSRNLEFKLSFEEYFEVVKNKCYYCNDLHERGFNGLDRIDSCEGYNIENIVSCCKMCNYLKKALDNSKFLKRIEHILFYNKIIEAGNLYPEAFANHVKINYNTYKRGACSRNLVFDLTEEKFNEIINKDCYICGKNKTESHKNGIDRYDSTLGYIFENCRPCCGECNVMKFNYTHQEFIQKLVKIYKNKIETAEKKEEYTEKKEEVVEKKEEVVEKNNKSIAIKEKKHKKTKEELKEEARVRKQKQRAKQRENLTEEEYKKMRAQEIANYRANKK
jgi:hypothetical protein